ncbi:hypothetical protein PPERSA_11336 [Pseudocohnilembus persalinus]|uniref:Thioesterase putative domain-containing protein n=1 Tax=Pseudocohnilembus persalinus TaxID=266149 RepID=A0A0V0QPU1_PSEPJ|nr:hypothetical protein PPERSA_11336 [Pseudocohnilembus persalinus]|eukprot:KRX04212.1 hypothetical protein PPERSA_11336 [Pseudocohnilembus persalinus]
MDNLDTQLILQNLQHINKESNFMINNNIKINKVLKCGSIQMVMGHKLNINHFGAIYAGSIYSLAQQAGKFAIYSFQKEKVVVQIKKSEIQYLIPGKRDLYVEIKINNNEQQKIIQEVNEHGKSNITLEFDIKEQNGTVVSKFKGHYIIEKKQNMPKL